MVLAPRRAAEYVAEAYTNWLERRAYAPASREPAINVASLVGYLDQHGVAYASDFDCLRNRSRRVIVRALAERLVAEGIWIRSTAIASGRETVAYEPA